MAQAEQAETWKMLSEEGRYLIDSQRTAGERVETKAAFVVGGALTAAQFISNQKVESYWLPCALAAYLVSIVSGLLAVRPRRFDNVGLTELVTGLWWYPIARANAEVANNRLEAFKANARRHQARVGFFWVALFAVAIGAGLSVAHLSLGKEEDGRFNARCTERAGEALVCTTTPG